jgi:PLP dependent protein
MAPYVEQPEQARPTFARLRSLRDELAAALGVELPELSMGMSNDFEVAVAEGATMVRLGRVLFGERPPRG